MDTKNKCRSEAEGLTYSKFINGLNKSGIKLDRKVLADIAYNNPEVFKSIVKKYNPPLTNKGISIIFNKVENHLVKILKWKILIRLNPIF